MNVQEYLRDDGSSPFQKWFKKLDAQAAAEVRVAIARLELGNHLKYQVVCGNW